MNSQNRLLNCRNIFSFIFHFVDSFLLFWQNPRTHAVLAIRSYSTCQFPDFQISLGFLLHLGIVNNEKIPYATPARCEGNSEFQTRRCSAFTGGIRNHSLPRGAIVHGIIRGALFLANCQRQQGNAWLIRRLE